MFKYIKEAWFFMYLTVSGQLSIDVIEQRYPEACFFVSIFVIRGDHQGKHASIVYWISIDHTEIHYDELFLAAVDACDTSIRKNTFSVGK